MEIKITTHDIRKAMNVWTLAAAAVDGTTYRIQMVRFDEPSMYGIRQGRIRYYERRKSLRVKISRKEFL